MVITPNAFPLEFRRDVRPGRSEAESLAAHKAVEGVFFLPISITDRDGRISGQLSDHVSGAHGSSDDDPGVQAA